MLFFLPVDRRTIARAFHWGWPRPARYGAAAPGYLQSRNVGLRQQAERMAINAPVQGTAADIIKIAMIRLHDEMKRRNLKSKMLLQVHDELLFEVPRSELQTMADIVCEIMEGAMQLTVPLKVEVKAGASWGEMQAVG